MQVGQPELGEQVASADGVTRNREGGRHASESGRPAEEGTQSSTAERFHLATFKIRKVYVKLQVSYFS